MKTSVAFIRAPLRCFAQDTEAGESRPESSWEGVGGRRRCFEAASLRNALQSCPRLAAVSMTPLEMGKCIKDDLMSGAFNEVRSLRVLEGASGR